MYRTTEALLVASPSYHSVSSENLKNNYFHVEKYLESDEIKFSQLINMAVEKFISELQTIELKPVGTQDFFKTA